MTIRGVCLDIAGVLTGNGGLLPGAAETLRALDARGLPWRLLTNTSRRPQAAILDELRGLGLSVSADHLFSAPRALHDCLRERGLRPWLLVHPDIAGEFADLPQDEPDAVVICDAGERFDYRRLDAAFALLQAGAPLLAVGLNRHFQGAERLELDAGPFVRALEYAAGIKAEVVGKPGRAMFALAVASMGLAPEEVVMIGDDVDADVLGALSAGLCGMLVRTGKYRPGDEQRLPAAALADGCARCVADVSGLLPALGEIS